jgi:hypothetical protein
MSSVYIITKARKLNVQITYISKDFQKMFGYAIGDVYEYADISYIYLYIHL